MYGMICWFWCCVERLDSQIQPSDRSGRSHKRTTVHQSFPQQFHIITSTAVVFPRKNGTFSAGMQDRHFTKIHAILAFEIVLCESLKSLQLQPKNSKSIENKREFTLHRHRVGSASHPVPVQVKLVKLNQQHKKETENEQLYKMKTGTSIDICW